MSDVDFLRLKLFEFSLPTLSHLPEASFFSCCLYIHYLFKCREAVNSPTLLFVHPLSRRMGPDSHGPRQSLASPLARVINIWSFGAIIPTHCAALQTLS